VAWAQACPRPLGDKRVRGTGDEGDTGWNLGPLTDSGPASFVKARLRAREYTIKMLRCKF
jgi:hypothetical protein